MIFTESLDSGVTRITVRPNRSATWPQARGFLVLLGIPVVLVALGWWLAGIWVILPFAGLEFTLVALFMYHVSRQTLRKQVITVAPGQVTVVEGLSHAERFFYLKRPDAHLVIRDTGRDVDLPHLMIIDAISAVPVGSWLNREQRLALARALTDSGLVAVSNRWWTDNRVSSGTPR